MALEKNNPKLFKYIAMWHGHNGEWVRGEEGWLVVAFGKLVGGQQNAMHTHI